MSNQKQSSMDEKIASGIFWKIVENGGIQGIQLIVSLVIARVMLPDEYDLVALVTIFITICVIVIQYGFNTSLVQKKDADDLDFSTVFVLVTALGCLLYALLFIGSPLLADFFSQPRLVPVLRILAVNIFFCGFNSILYAKVAREMLFRKMCISCLFSVVLAGSLGIGLALAGAGVWAMVAQQLCYQSLVFFVLGRSLHWWPGLRFSLLRARGLFAFGWKILVASLIDTVYNNLYGLLIGRVYPSGMLALYSKGDQFPQFIASNMGVSIQAVILPVMSAKQDSPDEARQLLRESVTMGAYLLFPMMTGLAIVARPLITLLLTESWLGCVPFLQLMCFSYILWPIHVSNLQAVNGLGRSDIYLKLEIIKKIIGVTAIIISIPHGVMMMVALQPVTSLIGMFLNMYPNGRLLRYGIAGQLRDVALPAALSGLMALAILPLGRLPLGNFSLLLLQVLAGILVYAGLSALLRVPCFLRLCDLIRNLVKKG